MTGTSHTNRANALWNEFQESGDLSLLDDAVDLLRTALRDTKDLRQHASIMSNLATLLQAMSSVTNDDKALQESIHLLREALATAVEADPARPILTLNLAASLHARYELVGDVGDLLECVELARIEIGDDARLQAIQQHLLSTTLLKLYLAGGEPRTLDEAVSASYMAVNLTSPDDGTEISPRLTALAAALAARFEMTGDSADLAAAITAAQRALSYATPLDSHTNDLIANLGALLYSRFELTSSLADLAFAINLFSRAIASTDDVRPAALRNLGTAILSRFQRSGDAGDIDQAITLHRRAIAALPAGSALASDYLVDLGRCLSVRYRISGQGSDVLDAIGAMEDAVGLTPPGHPRIAGYLSALAETSFQLYDREADDTAAAMAARYWQQAASTVGANTSVRLKAARSWANVSTALGDWPSAADGYETAVALLPELLWRSPEHTDRTALHNELAALPCDAAACMIEIGRYSRALELLEFGRGVLWRWLLGVTTEFDELRRTAPDLDRLLARIRNVVDQTGVPVVQSHSAGSVDFASQRQALARDWAVLVENARSLPGFENFLRPPDAGELLAASAAGPVVVVNASRLRCDALILHPSGISIVPLPTLRYDEAVGRVNDFLSVVSQLGEPVSSTESLYRERLLTDLFAWLWDTIAEPLLNYMDLVPRDCDSEIALPRIWWCPTGPLAVLPLHAAGHVSQGGVVDYAVPSYTATVSQLLESMHSERAAKSGNTTDERPLLVSLASTPGFPGLPTAAREREIISRSAERLHPTVVTGGDATKSAVKKLLVDRMWVHFSCHGAAEIDQPWRNGINLHDRRLTLADLASLQTPISTVFFSSCETGAGGKRIADETMTLAATLQAAGAQHVVGALWSVRDKSSAVVADYLYRDLDDFPISAAHSAAQRLHEAVLQLRRTNPSIPSIWSCFAHYGP